MTEFDDEEFDDENPEDLCINSVFDFFEEYKDVDGFWDALREDALMEPDHEWWEEDEGDGFDAGFRLGQRAAEEGKPLTTLSWEGTNVFYWVGTEEEVLARLKMGWEAWQEEHPLPDPKEQRRKQLQAERDAANKKIAALQSQLQNIDSELSK